MPSDLDRQLDAAIDRLTGAGGAFASEAQPGAAVPVGLPATLPGFFRLFCARHGEKVALVAGEERLTFAELDALSDRVAGWMVGPGGIRSGDRVAIAMRNVPAFVLCYMAAAKAGAVATLVNSWWEEAELAAAMALTAPALVLADAERARRIAAAAPGLRVIEVPVKEPVHTALAPIRGAQGALPEVAPEADATILFTSGSTATPRGAVSTHRAVTAAVYNFMTYSAVLREVLTGAGTPPASPVTLIAAPLFHVTGAVALMLNSFALGRRMVLMPRWDAGEALRLIEQERVTYFSGVPALSFDLMRHPDAATRDLSSLSEILAGGAARPPAHVQRLRAAFPHANPGMGYGLTETNAVGCTNLRANYLAKPESTGRPQRPFVDIAILDAEGTRLAPGDRGEIAIRSAANMRGYWQDEAATRAAFTPDGYLRTGDIGFLDEYGYLFVVDRAKDIVLRGGENISCQEVEAALAAHPGVVEVCVFPLPDERLGETVAAVVRLERRSTVTADALAEFLRGRIARYKLPAQIHLSDAPLPRLGSGKVDRGRVRACHLAPANEQERSGAPPRPSLSGD